MSEQMPRIELGNIIESDKKAEKERAWANKLKELDEVGDLLGHGIDEQIKEVVAAFNLNGFNTNQSCEGHDNEGLGAPWVSIEAPNEPEERYVGEKKVFQDVADRYGISIEDVKRANNQAAWVEAIKLSAEMDEETPEFVVWRKENEKLRAKAEKLVLQFYQEHIVNESSKLVFDNIGGDGHFRIHNGGKDYSGVLEMDEQQKKGLGIRLLGYRAEMQAFGKFLKDNFFSKDE